MISTEEHFFFHDPVAHLYIFFGKMSTEVFYAYLIGVCFYDILSCEKCLYSFDINSLSVILLVNIFSHSVGCLFVLSMISFAVQKLFSLIRSHLFIFAFFKKIILNWIIIALQCCVGFCHTTTGINHKYTYVPSLVTLAPTHHYFWIYLFCLRRPIQKRLFQQVMSKSGLPVFSSRSSDVHWGACLGHEFNYGSGEA